ncbi:MAG: hypothetical protein KDA96_12015, partial [Planctomycetaceae bacterium]|nr:hypothetical protein [Planctomycetaceae bacterium]
VNGNRVELENRINEGDIVSIGDVEFRFYENVQPSSQKTGADDVTAPPNMDIAGGLIDVIDIVDVSNVQIVEAVELVDDDAVTPPIRVDDVIVLDDVEIIDHVEVIDDVEVIEDLELINDVEIIEDNRPARRPRRRLR